jgi:alkaline phosphatase
MKTRYRRVSPILISTFLAGLLLLVILIVVSEPPVYSMPARHEEETGALQELLPGFDYADWYQQTTGYTVHERYFGAYSLEPVGNELYLGYGTARPAEADGSLLAVTNGSVITAVSQLTEQGFIDMQAVENTLYIPGVDPCCGDGWDFGNFYIKSPGQPITKQRNLPNVVHTWGVWFDAQQDILYTAVSSHLGDNETWTGEIFSSTNQGVDWVRVGNYLDGLGDSRTYDITGFAGRLYAVWSDDPDVNPDFPKGCGLTVSEDAGLTWTRITSTTNQPLACRVRLHVWQNQLLALSHDQKSLIVVKSDQQIAEKSFIDFRISAWAYHSFAHDDAGYLYMFSEYGDVFRTKDLQRWERVVNSDLDLFSIAYWPTRNQLVLGERGNGRLWTLDLANLEPDTQNASPAKNIILMIADGWGANHIAAANDYTNQIPTYQTWPRYWLSTYQAGNRYQPQLAWSDFGYPLQSATDSAAAATALFTSIKTANGRIAVNKDATVRLLSLSEKAQALNKATGAVTSVYLSHATPGAWMSHNASRGHGFAIADEGFWGDSNTTGTADEDGRYDGGFGSSTPQDVVIGAGHPDWQGSSYVNLAMRDKLANESGQPGAFLFVERLSGSADGGTRLLSAASLTSTTRLAGLFGGGGGNLEYRLADGSGHNPENPTLAQMTTAALTVLNRSPHGFVLLVEGGAVDWASHSNQMDRMVGEMIGFNEAVQTVIDWVDEPANGSSWDNTLLLITGDHETGYLTAAPDVFPERPLGTIDTTTLGLEKVITGTGRRASWQDANANDEIDEGEQVYWAWNSGGHSNSLIPVYARGVGAKQLSRYATQYDPVRGAYLDNTAVFSLVDAVLGYKMFLPIVAKP